MKYRVTNSFAMPTGDEGVPGEMVEMSERLALPYVNHGWLVPVVDEPTPAETEPTAAKKRIRATDANQEGV